MSDNWGSYENRSYLRCLLIDFEKVDCSVIGRWPSVDFQDGGPKPEVVFFCTVSCRRRVFSVDSDCRRRVLRETIEKTWRAIIEPTHVIDESALQSNAIPIRRKDCETASASDLRLNRDLQVVELDFRYRPEVGAATPTSSLEV